MTNEPLLPDDAVYSTLFCSAAYHISQLKGKGAKDAFILYDRCCALGHETKKSFINLRNLAPYLHVHETALYAAASLLVDAGWLLVESRKSGSPTTYRPVSHDAYAFSHRDTCVQTYSPDYWTQDQLGKSIYGLTGGIKIGGPNVLAGWRKLFAQDEIILIHAEKYLQTNPKPKHKHEYTIWLKGFGSYLREQSC
jgi:hypothetical protein